LYFLVHVGVLHNDKPVQLANEDRIVPFPDLWWQSDADADTYANTYANTNTNSYTDTDADADTYADACACAERAEQSRWQCRLLDSDQSVVAG
jgi:hypothetical protein